MKPLIWVWREAGTRTFFSPALGVNAGSIADAELGVACGQHPHVLLTCRGGKPVPMKTLIWAMRASGMPASQAAVSLSIGNPAAGDWRQRRRAGAKRRCGLLQNAPLVVIVCLAIGWLGVSQPVPWTALVLCWMGSYDPEHWSAHYTMVHAVRAFDDRAGACDGILPCGDPPLGGTMTQLDM